MNLVASPVTMGRMPVAIGSKIPNIPAFFILVLFLKIDRVLLDVMNFFLLIKNTTLDTNTLSQ